MEVVVEAVQKLLAGFRAGAAAPAHHRYHLGRAANRGGALAALLDRLIAAGTSAGGRHQRSPRPRHGRIWSAPGVLDLFRLCRRIRQRPWREADAGRCSTALPPPVIAAPACAMIGDENDLTAAGRAGTPWGCRPASLAATIGDTCRRRAPISAPCPAGWRFRGGARELIADRAESTVTSVGNRGKRVAAGQGSSAAWTRTQIPPLGRPLRTPAPAIGHAIAQMPWRIPLNTDRPTEPLPPEGVAAIHDAAMRILEEIGIEFLNAEARDYLGAAGCAPAGGQQRAYGPRPGHGDGGQRAAPVRHHPAQSRAAGDDGRRPHVLCQRLVAAERDGSRPWLPGRRLWRASAISIKPTQYSNCIHVAGGYPVEPVDIHASIRHLDRLCQADADRQGGARLSLGSERVEDVIEMARIASGLGQAEFESQPRLFTNINSSSPLKHDWPMLDGAMRFARRGQPVIVTPFTLAGAMAPVTMAGAVVQSIAEALAAIVLLQIVRPGVACMIGTFTSNVDMKSAPRRSARRNTPRHADDRADGALLRPASARLQRLRLQRPDAQAMWESMNSSGRRCRRG